MNTDKLISHLNASLNEARNINNRFKANLSEADKGIIAKNFQNEILSILDYMYTNFPVERILLGGYFPRPSLLESSSEYKNRVKEFKKNKKLIEHPKQVADFLQDFYELNKKHQSAISYIQSKVKHETPNQFNDESVIKLDVKLTSNHPAPIQHFPDGSIDVMGFRFGKGSNVTIKNSVFSGGGFSTVIENLEFREIKITGDKIIFNNEVEFNFNEWATNCINICEQSFESFKKYWRDLEIQIA